MTSKVDPTQQKQMSMTFLVVIAAMSIVIAPYLTFEALGAAEPSRLLWVAVAFMWIYAALFARQVIRRFRANVSN